VFFLRRIWRGLPHNVTYSSRKERFIRSLALCLAIILVCWGFWQNSKSYVKKFSLEKRIDDVQKILGDEYKTSLTELTDRVETKYGVKIYIKISPLPITSADAVPGAILLGVCPKGRQFAALMPDSWHSALGEGFILRLREEIMLPAFAPTPQTSPQISPETSPTAWQTALLLVLEQLEKRIGEL
jgi:hypothetical protein